MLRLDKRGTATISLLMMLLCATQVLSVVNAGSGPGSPPEPPGNAYRVNMSDMVPQGYAYMYNASGPHVLQFRNMTMQFYANREMVVNVSGEPGLRLQYLDMQLRLQNSLTLQVRARLGPPEGVEPPGDGVYHYLEIEPNNTAGIQARLRLYVDEEEMSGLANRSVNRHQLRWCYWDGSDWAPVHSWIDSEGFLVCDTDHFSLWTIREMKNPPSMPTPDIPGLPDHAKAYNYSHLTPQAFQWSAMKNEGVMFAFRNMNMLLNCTRNLEMNITAGNDVEQRLFQLQLSPDAPIMLQLRLRVDPPGGLPTPENGMGFYADVESNGTGPLTARLGLHIDAEGLGEKLNREVNASRLRWAYWNGSVWETVDSALDGDDVLECEVEHLSTWTILEVVEEEGDQDVSDDDTGGMIPGFTYPSVLAGLFLALLLVYIFRNK